MTEAVGERIGWGFDAHRLGGPGPLLLAGVVVDPDAGLIGTSDADVAAHAAADALLGAAALGDLGAHFPSTDPAAIGADSVGLLRTVRRMVNEAGWVVGNLDLTIVAESIRIEPHREAMRARLAEALEVEVDRVSVKATSTDGLGSVGAGEGIAATAVVLLRA
jgi:2-C-methyl-D-erythritol 2,4-cyclodiphosphate synthase